MAEFTVEITGADRDQLAQELSEHITAQQGQAQIYAETEKFGDPLTTATAVVSAVLAGIQAADIIWKWWQSRRKSGGDVTIRTASGQVIELSGVTSERLKIILQEDD